jgi:hypothetical protein
LEESQRCIFQIVGTAKTETPRPNARYKTPNNYESIVFSNHFRQNKMLVVSLLVGSAFGAGIRSNMEVWQPTVGSKWQIMIHNNVSVDLSVPLQPSDAPNWDIDLFNTPVEIFKGLHDQGKKIICYFSAGTGEDWRPDYSQFQSSDLGDALSDWPGERYLNIKSDSVWNVMKNRIQLGSQKGCDAIDPDNMGKFGSQEPKENLIIFRWLLQRRRWFWTH